MVFFGNFVLSGCDKLCYTVILRERREAGMNLKIAQALELIVRKSPALAERAAWIMRSSAPQPALRAIATEALRDGEWTEEERILLFQALGHADTNEERRTKLIAFRVTPTEYDQLAATADEIRMSLSDYIRVTLGL